ncbi:MAG TPA: SHOCT domain-containing protein [Candidatus Saccharimonadales bacterium]|nr:SHOCT domain-containing protein [Candidatus Saccharimonadales bacterium]
MGPRRRARRRGLVAGAAVGAAVGHHAANKANEQAAQEADYQAEPQQSAMAQQLQELEGLKNQGIITQDEFDAKKQQILGL